MFYGNIILGKKGPLAKLWLAAHWEKKLSKAHVFETDVPSAVDNLISPSVKIALRTSGHLLLGVVRIYSRKTKYLLADCSEAFVKIKMAFRPGLVDLPEDNREVAASTITLPEFQEWDAIVNDLSTFDLHAQITLNQSRVEEITMKEDLFGSNFILDDNFFGDTPFGEVNEKELLRDASSLVEESHIESDASRVSIAENDKLPEGKEPVSVKETQLELQEPMQEEGFGMGEGLDFLEELMEAEPPADPTLEPLDINLSGAAVENEQEEAVVPNEDAVMADAEDAVAETGFDQTTLIVNQDEAFPLEPIEDAALGRKKQRKRKRKLVVDEEKIIKGDVIRAQLEDTSDIVVAASVAPPTKLRMRLMETSTVKFLFSMPSIELFSKHLLSAYTRHLTTDPVEDLEDVEQSEEEHLQLDAPELELVEQGQADQAEEVPQEGELESPDGDKEKEAPEPENISSVDNLFIDVTQGLVGEKDTFEEELNENEGDQTKGNEFDENEELIDEKDEEAQERRWTKRTHQTLRMLQREFKKKDSVHLSNLLRKKDSKKQAACLFSTVLILRKEKGIATEQSQPFEDIVITKGARFQELL